MVGHGLISDPNESGAHDIPGLARRQGEGRDISVMEFDL
jgi:hypothetical protein